jgi:hypothetical protein
VQAFSIDASKAPQDSVFADHEGNIVSPPLAGTPSYVASTRINKGNVTFVGLRAEWTYRYIYPKVVYASLALNFTSVDSWDNGSVFSIALPFVPSQPAVFAGASRQGQVIFLLKEGSLSATLARIEPYYGYIVPYPVVRGSGDSIYVSGLYATQ